MRKLLHANVSCLRYDRAFWLLAALMDRRVQRMDIEFSGKE